jgi:phage gpG-like protein
MRPLFQDVTEYMIEATRQRFAKGVDPDGNAWAPKAQSTLDRYKRMGYGKLPRPLIGAGRRLSREIGEATRDGSVIGSALIYSRVMQDGAEKGEFGNDRRGRPIPGAHSGSHLAGHLSRGRKADRGHCRRAPGRASCSRAREAT